MRLSLTLSRSYPVAPETVFDFTNEASNFTSFVGFGIVPGIREASYETDGGPRLGSRRRVVKTDGTEHLEEIIAFERPWLHVSRIVGLAPPLGWIVQEAEDAWRFAGDNTETRVRRTFSFALRSPLWSAVAFPLMHVFLRVAISRDLRNIAAALPRRSEV